MVFLNIPLFRAKNSIITLRTARLNFGKIYMVEQFYTICAA